MAEGNPVNVGDVVDRMGVKIYDLLNVDEGVDLSQNKTLGAAIETANDTIYGYLRKRYKLPLADRDAKITSIGKDLARHELIQSTRPESFDPIKDQATYDDAIRYLKSVADGTIALTFAPVNREETLAPASLVAIGGQVTNDDKPSMLSMPGFSTW